MSIDRIEAELIAVTARIQRLAAEMQKAKDWECELATSLRVLRRLSGKREAAGTAPHTEPDAEIDTPAYKTFENAHPVTDPALARKAPRGRSPTILRAEAALVAMLKEKGDFIRQLDAVNRLRTEHGIIVGAGIPGRETSDLSAALGAGKSPLLAVSRRLGWELKEWDGRPPVYSAVTRSAPSADEKRHETPDDDVDAVFGGSVNRKATMSTRTGSSSREGVCFIDLPGGQNSSDKRPRGQLCGLFT